VDSRYGESGHIGLLIQRAVIAARYTKAENGLDAEGLVQTQNIAPTD
jgi:hypothetical protein